MNTYEEEMDNYVRGLEKSNYDLERAIEQKDAEIAELGRENTILREQLDNYGGVH